MREIHDALGKVPLQALSGESGAVSKSRRQRPVTNVERHSGIYPDSPAQRRAGRNRREQLYKSVLACIREQVIGV